MLAAGTAIEGSAGYVAIEQATGTLHGRSGSFVLQHNGTMARGAGQLTITVVPDSGTGELVGLAGTMTITIVDGKHLYDSTTRSPKADLILVAWADHLRFLSCKGIRPAGRRFLLRINSFAYAGGGKGRSAPPAPPARDFVPQQVSLFMTVTYTQTRTRGIG